jgi:hypothetical protein
LIGTDAGASTMVAIGSAGETPAASSSLVNEVSVADAVSETRPARHEPVNFP